MNVVAFAGTCPRLYHFELRQQVHHQTLFVPVRRTGENPASSIKQSGIYPSIHVSVRHNTLHSWYSHCPLINKVCPFCWLLFHKPWPIVVFVVVLSLWCLWSCTLLVAAQLFVKMPIHQCTIIAMTRNYM